MHDTRKHARHAIDFSCPSSKVQNNLHRTKADTKMPWRVLPAEWYIFSDDLARNFMHKEGVVSEEALWARFASGEEQGQAF